MCATTSPPSASTRFRFSLRIAGCAHPWQDGRSPRRRSCTPACRSPCSASPTRATATASFRQRAAVCARVFPACRSTAKPPYPGVTVAGTRQWLNPDAFVSVVDPTTGACTGGDSAANCQFGDAGRNTVRGPHFTDSDIYLTKTFPVREGRHVALRRADVQRLQPSQLCVAEQCGGRRAGRAEDIPANFGTLESTISPPTGLLGVGLGGDSSPRMIAFQARIEF